MIEEISAKKRLVSIARDFKIPYAASMEIITKCNFNCIHCYIPKHTKVMPTPVILNALDQMREIGVLDLMLTGGEIFLHQDIMDIVAYARSKGMRVTLFTNLSLLDENNVKRLAELYITQISTTLFSLDEIVNDGITCSENSVTQILENLRLLKKYGINTEVKVPILKQNKDGIFDIRKFCEENGFTFNFTTAITSRTNGDRTPLDYAISQQDLNEILPVLDDDDDSQDFWKTAPLCSAMCTSLHIDVDGNVSPCISFLYIIGNIYQKTLQEIWGQALDRCEIFKIKKQDLSECSDCDLKDYCVRCPGLAYTEDKTLLGCSSLDRRTAVARKCYRSLK